MTAVESYDPFPLTSLQKSMVLASMRAPRSGVYILQDICELSESLDSELLEAAWHRVAQRHPALRTSVAVASGNKLFEQRVHQKPSISWRKLDWSSAVAEQNQDRLEEFLREDRERGFDFDDHVPMRFTLIRTSERSHTLIWTIHHVLVDGRSLAIAWQEWFKIYDALRRGEEAHVPIREAFRSHVDWLQQQDPRPAEQFWRQYFEGITQTAEYVIDRTRTSQGVSDDDFGKERTQLSAELTAELFAFAERNGVTVNTLVQGAWAVLLSRYSGRSDICFGATRAGRQSSTAGAAGIVGVLINTLPIRIAAPPQARLLPWLKQLREQWIALREYEHTPVDKIWEWSGLPAGTPPFDNLAVYEHEPLAETLRSLGETWRQRVINRRQRTDSPLTLVAYGKPLVTLEIVFSQRLFGGAFVAGMMMHLATLLESFAKQADCCLAELRMLPESEEHRLVQELNRNEVSFPRNLCVHRLFEQQVARTPEHAAFETPGGTISYQQANRRANRLAGYLSHRGAGPEDFIAVCIARSPEATIAVLAVLKAGAAFLPLDPRLPPGRLVPMLEDARARFVLSDDAGCSKFESSSCEVLNISRLESEVANRPADNLPDIATPAHAAYAIYTSGSTGTPKAVVLSHQSLANHTLAATRAYGVSESDRRLQFAWMGTDFFVAEVFNNLCAGSTLVLCLDQQGNSVAEFLRILNQHRITIAGIPSSWWHEWVAALSEGDSARPSSLRVVITGMEQVNPSALQTWKQVVGHSIRWFNAYGPTETSPTTTIYEAGSSAWEGGKYVPIGRPLANTRAYVLDGAKNPVPVGVAGELYIAGAGVARGYLNAPELTAQKFLPDPFSADPTNRMYRTGDQGFLLPDGNLVFLGRLDRQIKIRGYRVELDEIEAVLARHPAVRACAVVVQGQGNEVRLVAYVTVAGPAEAAPGILRKHLATCLPAHMLPAAFAILPEMPLTLAGKIDRHALPRHVAEPPAQDRIIEQPSNPTEKRLAALWRQTLDFPAPDTSANFFELGGDSMKAAQLIMLIRQQFGLELSFETLLRGPTIARIAAVLDNADSSACTNLEWNSVLPLQPNGSLTPLFCIASTMHGEYCFRPLSKHLGEDQPFLVVRNLIREQEPLPAIEDLAARACQSIRRVRPHGPYILGGYCFGGTVAFETARQLTSLGEEVRLIALFDTPAPGYPKLVAGHRRNWRQLGEVVRGAGKRAGRVGVRQLISHLDMAGQLIRKKIVAKADRRLARLELTSLIPTAGEVAKWQERSTAMYVPKRMNVPVVQFVARDEAISTRILDDPRLAWRDLAGSEFHLHPVRGSHGTLLKEPQALEVAQILGNLLRRANQGGSDVPAGLARMSGASA